MPITLMYHDVVRHGFDDASGFTGSGAARYKLTLTEFHGHLAHIDHATSGNPAASIESAGDGLQPWILTFDDGGVSSATHIADALEARNWRGWFFITTDRISTPGFVNREQVRQLHQRGHVIGTHSCSHPARFSYCTADRQFDEWKRSREVLEDLLGVAVRSGSVPGGFYTRSVAQAAARAGLEILFNSEPTMSVATIEGCRILGRYTVYRGMSAPQAATLLTSPWARRRQSLLWSAKKFAKRTGGESYLRLRESLLKRAYAPAT